MRSLSFRLRGDTILLLLAKRRKEKEEKYACSSDFVQLKRLMKISPVTMQQSLLGCFLSFNSLQLFQE